MNCNPWWVPLLSVVIGAILGYALIELREWRRRNQEKRGHFEALAVEIQICSELAGGYVKDKVMAPAYRMPLIAYERSLPALLAEGVLKFSEINALLRFYVNVQAFNLAIDQAQAVLMIKDENRPPKKLELEVGRARLKAKKLVKNGEKANHYDSAIEIVRRHLPKDSQNRLSIEREDLSDGEED